MREKLLPPVKAISFNPGTVAESNKESKKQTENESLFYAIAMNTADPKNTLDLLRTIANNKVTGKSIFSALGFDSGSINTHFKYYDVEIHLPDEVKVDFKSGEMRLYFGKGEESNPLSFVGTKLSKESERIDSGFRRLGVRS